MCNVFGVFEVLNYFKDIAGKKYWKQYHHTVVRNWHITTPNKMSSCLELVHKIVRVKVIIK